MMLLRSLSVATRRALSTATPTTTTLAPVTEASRQLNLRLVKLKNPHDIENFVATRDDLDRTNLSCAFIAVANTKCMNSETIDKLTKLCNGMQFDQEDLSIISLAIAQSEILPELPEPVINQATQCEYSRPLAITNMLTALANLPNQPQANEVVSKLVAGMAGPDYNFYRYSTTQLYKVATCASKLGVKNPIVYQRLAKEFARERDLSSLPMPHLIHLATAFAKTEVQYPQLFQKLARVMLMKPFWISPSSTTNWERMVNLAWAFSTQQPMDYHPILYDIMCKHCEQLLVSPVKVQEITATQVASLLRAFTMQNYKADRMCSVLTPEFVRKISTATSHDLATMLYAFARLAFVPEKPTLNAVLEEVCKRDVDVDSACVTLWSLACMDALHHEKVREYFTRQGPTNGAQVPRTEVNARRLFEAKLAWRQTNKSMPAALQKKPTLLDSLAEGNWISLLVQQMDRPFSKLQIKLCEVVLEQHPDAFNNAVLMGGLTADIHVPSQNTVVLIDTPMDFYVNKPAVKTAKSMFRERLFTAAGYRTMPLLATRFTRGGLREAQRVVKLIGNSAAKDKK